MGEKALIPQAIRNLFEDPKFGRTTLGGTLGLLASAANDGLVGGFISNLLGATIGSGVAIVTATGAFVGFLTANAKEEKELIQTQEERPLIEVIEKKSLIEVQ